MKPLFFRYALLPFLAAALTSAAAASDAPVYDDEDLLAFIGKSSDFRSVHGLMAGQRERLHAIQDAFLLGDEELIVRQSGEMAAGMEKVRQVFSDPGSHAAARRLISEIADGARQMQAAAEARDFKKAYESYGQVMGRCIQCHQAARDWGRFSEASAEKKPAA